LGSALIDASLPLNTKILLFSSTAPHHGFTEWLKFFVEISRSVFQDLLTGEPFLGTKVRASKQPRSAVRECCSRASSRGFHSIRLLGPMKWRARFPVAGNAQANRAALHEDFTGRLPMRCTCTRMPIMSLVRDVTSGLTVIHSTLEKSRMTVAAGTKG
jgi:hypothetical protein